MNSLHKSILAVLVLAGMAFAIWPDRSTETSEPDQSRHDEDGHDRRSIPDKDTRSAIARHRRDSQLEPRLGEVARIKWLEELASTDPEKALDELAGIADADLKLLAHSAIAAGWARLAPSAAAAWVASLESDETRTNAALGLIPPWVERNPDQCLEWVSTCPPGNLREVALVELADAWSSKNPKEALGRFLGLAEEQGRERGIHAIISQWSSDAPLEVVAHLSADHSPKRDEMLEAALVSISNNDPEYTWKHSVKFANPKTVEHVRSMALESMAEQRPTEAIRLAATANNTEVLLAGIARGWSATDATASRQWVQSLPDPELAARLLKQISE